MAKSNGMNNQKPGEYSDRMTVDKLGEVGGKNLMKVWWGGLKGHQKLDEMINEQCQENTGGGGISIL